MTTPMDDVTPDAEQASDFAPPGYVQALQDLLSGKTVREAYEAGRASLRAELAGQKAVWVDSNDLDGLHVGEYDDVLISLRQRTNDVPLIVRPAPTADTTAPIAGGKD